MALQCKSNWKAHYRNLNGRRCVCRVSSKFLHWQRLLEYSQSCWQWEYCALNSRMHCNLNDFSSDNTSVFYVVSCCCVIVYLKHNLSVSLLLSLQIYRLEIRNCHLKIFFCDLLRYLDILHDSFSHFYKVLPRLESYFILLSRRLIGNSFDCASGVVVCFEEKRNLTC